MTNETIRQTAEEFFKRRFPNFKQIFSKKDTQFNKNCGYFGQWVYRFSRDNVTEHMDSVGLKIWEEMKKEGFN